MGEYQDDLMLPISTYEARNLLLLIEDIMVGSEDHLHMRCSGDWVGQLRWKLEAMVTTEGANAIVRWPCTKQGSACAEC